jgi:radical SAM protein with 4Fe4S-binding SPASM domain
MSKLIKFPQIFLSIKVFKRIVLPYLPESITIEVTNQCCFKCHFCLQSNPDHFKHVTPKILKPEEADILLKKIRQGGVTTRTMHWTLDGEPFLNKHFVDIVKIAVHYDFTNHMFSTNGLFAIPETLAQLPRDNVFYTLYIDFCADQYLFEQIRGTPNSWEKVKHNVSAARANVKLSHIQIRITDISNWCEPDSQILAENRRKLSDLFHGQVVIDYRDFHNMTGFLNRKSLNKQQYFVCPYPWIDFVVASNGDVVACCRDLEHKTVLGNLVQQSLQTIWNGETSQALRKALLEKRPDKMSACRGCDMPYDCRKMGLKNIVKSAMGRYQVFDVVMK